MTLSNRVRMRQLLKRPPWRTLIPGGLVLALLWGAYSLWSPGLKIRDGRHDRERNGLWLAHGWLGADECLPGSRHLCRLGDQPS